MSDEHTGDTTEDEPSDDEPPDESPDEPEVYPEYPLTDIRRRNGKWQYRSDCKPDHLESTIVSDATILRKLLCFRPRPCKSTFLPTNI